MCWPDALEAGRTERHCATAERISKTNRHPAKRKYQISVPESITGLTNCLTHDVDQSLWCLWVGVWTVEYRQFERHHYLLLEAKELLWVGRRDQNGSEVLLCELP